jgi:L-2-hydroxyglutarate oxidase LhgO
MTESVECIVVGAGVVGLAVARALAEQGREVLVAEAQGAIGTETSSRNSEVIHAGIYYPKGSLKAELCIQGRDLLYTYCATHGVPHRRCGKLIVASDTGQLEEIDRILARGRANGVTDLRRFGGNEIAALEPEVRSVGGIFSPSSGIVDSHAFMLALRGDVESAGAMIAFHTPLAGGRANASGIEIDFGGEQPTTLSTRLLVNAAGLAAPAVARSIAGLPEKRISVARYAKGNYFRLEGRSPFSRLVYPVPEPGGLGVHATIDLAGQTRFGPDVQWLDDVDPAALGYAVDPARAERFYHAIRQYWPGLPDGALKPDYSGMRPKIAFGGVLHDDFSISTEADHGVPGVVNLFGIESPGLTASLAIAEKVARFA